MRLQVFFDDLIHSPRRRKRNEEERTPSPIAYVALPFTVLTESYFGPLYRLWTPY